MTTESTEKPEKITGEDIRINVGPFKLLATLAGTCALLISGNLWMINTAIASNNAKLIETVNAKISSKLADHTARPHPITVQRAEEIAKEVVERDHRTQIDLNEKLAQMAVTQGVFINDIDWIKRQMILTNEKLDQLVKEKSRNGNGNSAGGN